MSIQFENPQNTTELMQQIKLAATNFIYNSPVVFMIKDDNLREYIEQQQYKEHGRRYRKKWREENSEKIRNYLKSPQGKLIYAKHNDWRKRNMGSNIINDWFIGCNRHHINKTDIICIPAYIHKQYWHNHKKPETMLEINRIAFEYLTENMRQI